MIKQAIIKYFSITLIFVLASGSALSLAQTTQKEKAKNTAGSLSSEQKVIHMLNRITFGPRPGDLERVMKIGWQKYLAEQLHPEHISDEVVGTKLKELESIRLDNRELANNYVRPNQVRRQLRNRGLEIPQPAQEPGPQGEMARQRREVRKALDEMGIKPQQEILQELQQAKILRAVYSEKQLQEVMTDFWFNHFNVYGRKGADRLLTTSYERDSIRPRVFGKFEDLLIATAESEAMLFYLDNWLSVSPNAQMGMNRMRRLRRMQSMPNQNGKIPNNRSRGLNENYAREIMELHTLGVDGGYTQKDVQEVARCFTGWTIRGPRAGGDFYFNQNMHDDGEKVVLGKKIPAGGGRKDGETVIHILATHPATAKFISTKLARKFVSDNPPQSLVDRLAGSFLKTGGDIRQVLSVLFNSPEFWAPENYRAKIKTPFEMTVSAARATGAETSGAPPFHRWIAKMGEGLYLAQPPTGYPETAENWVNTGALLDRMNFALALSSNNIPGTRVDLDKLVSNTNSMKASQIVDQYVRILLRSEMSPETRATIDKTLNGQMAMNNGQSAPGIDISKVVGLILGSPEFQRQ